MTSIPESGERSRRGNGDRRRAPFTKGDIATLVCGALLVASMTFWLTFLVADNAITDRAVAAGRPPSPERSH